MPRLRTRDGQALHYYDIGRGEPVVLLHGFGMSGALWLPVVLPLAGRYRFLLPDLRGFGFSHRLSLADPSAIGQHARDVDDLITGLDLHDVRLGGLSMGACTALEYQRAYGIGRLRSYLHIDQAPRIRNGSDWEHGLLGADQEARFEIWRTLLNDLSPHRAGPLQGADESLRRRLCEVMSEFLGYAFHTRRWQVLGRLARHENFLNRVMPTANWPVYIDTLRSFLEEDYDWRASLAKLDLPVTLHVGMESRMYPAAGQLQMAEMLPRAQVVRFDGCGHTIPFEAPGRFVKHLSRFLSS